MINRKFLYISNAIVDIGQVCIFRCKDYPNEQDKQTAWAAIYRAPQHLHKFEKTL